MEACIDDLQCEHERKKEGKSKFSSCFFSGFDPDDRPY